MKNILLLSLLLSSAAVVGCTVKPEIHTGRPIITFKSQIGNSGECTYKYIGLGRDGEQYFYDDCKLYHVGDTLKSELK